MRAKISVILRVVLSAGLILFLLWGMRGRFPHIAGTLARTNIILFALATLIFMLNLLTMSLRLRLLLGGEGLRIPFIRVTQLCYIGYFFNNFMPTAVGGDIVKAYYVSKQTSETAKSFICVFVDRFIGLFSFICIATVALFASWNNIDTALRKVVFIFAFSGVAVFLVILNGATAKLILRVLSKFKLWNMGERLSKVYRAVHEYRNKKTILLLAMCISLAGQSVYFSIIYLLGRSLGANLPLSTVFLLMPIVTVVSMLPSLGGLGLREGAIVVLFGSAIGSDNAFSVSILLLALLLTVSLVGAAIYASASQFKIKQADISKLDSYRV